MVRGEDVDDEMSWVNFGSDKKVSDRPRKRTAIGLQYVRSTWQMYNARK